MVRKTQLLLEDDLTGDVLEDGSGETVVFSLDGTHYEIDLSTENSAQLWEDVAGHVGAGRKVGASTGRRPGGSAAPAKPASARRSDLAEIREWAKANGHEVSERHRIAAAVVEAYDAAR